jgi:hypothetical protein
MTKVIFKSAIALFILLGVGAISGCGDDNTPQNSNIHFTNSTDKEITIIYRQEVRDPFNDTVTTESKSDQIPVGGKKILTIQESVWTVYFTVVYNGVEYDKSISVNFIGGDEDYNVSLQSLGLISNG